MSSSAAPKSEAVVVVQTGVLAWEDPVPLTDWRYKTVTLIGSQLPLIAKLLWDLIASRPFALQRMFRVLVVPKPTAATAAQMRRFVTQLAADPPGFMNTKQTVLSDVGCSVSELREISVVDVNFLTDYRHCALVGTSSTSSPTANLCAEIGSEISEFDNVGLAKLLQSSEDAVVIRVLETQPFSVVQLLGAPEFCDVAVRFFEDRKVRRVHDVRRINQEIQRTCG